MELGKAGTDDWYKQNFWGLCGWCTTFFCGGGAWFLIDAQSRWISWNNKGYGSETAAKYGPKDCIWMGLAVFWGSSTRWKGKMGSFWDPERIPKVRFFKKKVRFLKRNLGFTWLYSGELKAFKWDITWLKLIIGCELEYYFYPRDLFCFSVVTVDVEGRR